MSVLPVLPSLPCQIVSHSRPIQNSVWSLLLILSPDSGWVGSLVGWLNL